MKFERIDDSKFNCTISNEELQQLNLQLSDLTYGSKTARKFFGDVLKHAHKELNFDVDDQPIMIEAIPTEEEGLIIQFSRIEEPEELDSRFASFAPYIRDTSADELSEDGTDPFSVTNRADDILNHLIGLSSSDTAANDNLPADAPTGKQELLSSFRQFLERIQQDISKTGANEDETPETAVEDNNLKSLVTDTTTKTKTEKTSRKTDISGKQIPENLCIIFRFEDFDTLCHAAAVTWEFPGKTMLYKSQQPLCYHLILYSNQVEPSAFNRVCNVLSEYGEMMLQNTELLVSHFEEHHICMIKEQALQRLAQL